MWNKKFLQRIFEKKEFLILAAILSKKGQHYIKNKRSIIQETTKSKQTRFARTEQREYICKLKTAHKLAGQKENNKIIGHNKEDSRVRVYEITYSDEPSRRIAIHIANNNYITSYKSI